MKRIFLVLALVAGCLAENTLGADKPRTRATAENRDANLQRYKLGGFGPNANATLGVQIKFVEDQQGVTILGFEADSTAKTSGLKLNDIVLEVDGAPVGLIRNRHYELWPMYGRSGENQGKYLSEVLVSYVHSDGDRRYYFPVIPTQKLVGAAPGLEMLPDDFFTSEKPVSRTTAESRDKNIARYVFGWGNFQEYGKYELGVTLDYSYEYGGTIQTVKPNSAAAKAGLKVGDSILEVAGAPVGQFGDRLYEVWRQYAYDEDGKVEFLIVYEDDATGENRYYYPEITLDPLSTTN